MSVDPRLTPIVPSERVVARSRFRTNLVRVLAIQVVALLLLWLLQWHFSH